MIAQGAATIPISSRDTPNLLQTFLISDLKYFLVDSFMPCFSNIARALYQTLS